MATIRNDGRRTPDAKPTKAIVAAAGPGRAPPAAAAIDGAARTPTFVRGDRFSRGLLDAWFEHDADADVAIVEDAVPIPNTSGVVSLLWIAEKAARSLRLDRD